MRIYMQSANYSDGAPKYLQLVLQQELLGGWSLVVESGRQGGRGRVKREDFETYDQAMEALMKMRDSHVGKGFRVVFFQGEMQE